MSIVILQSFKAVEGRYSELSNIIATMLVDTAARAGAEFMHAAGDPASGEITIYEQWDSPENQQAYVAWRMQQPDIGKLMTLLGGPPKIQQLAKLY